MPITVAVPESLSKQKRELETNLAQFSPKKKSW